MGGNLFPRRGGGSGGIGSRRLLKAVAFGDSLTFRFSTNDGVNWRTNQTSYLAWALAKQDWPIDVVNNAGVSGNTTTQMLARIQSDVMAYTPDLVFFLGGINDPTNSIPLATTIANIQAIVNTITATGALVIIGTVWPSSVINTDSRRNWLYETNSFIKSLPSTNSNVFVVDSNAAISTNTGTYGPNTLLDESGTFLHPTAYGAELVSRGYADILRAMFEGQTEREWSTGAYFATPIANGIMQGNAANGTNGFSVGAGITGTGPFGWGLTRTGSTMVATCSKVARSDYLAQEWFRVVIGTGGADLDRLSLSKGVFFRLWSSFGTADFIRRFYVPATGAQYEVVTAGALSGTDNTNTWPTVIGSEFTNGTAVLRCVDPLLPGDRVRLYSNFRLSNVAVGQITPWATVAARNVSNTVLIQAFAGHYDSLQGTAPQLDGELIFASPEITIPATFDLSTTTGSTGPNLYVEASFVTRGGATGTCDFGPLILQKATN